MFKIFLVIVNFRKISSSIKRYNFISNIKRKINFNIELANHYLSQNLLLLVYPYIKKMSSY